MLWRARGAWEISQFPHLSWKELLTVPSGEVPTWIWQLRQKTSGEWQEAQSCSLA